MSILTEPGHPSIGESDSSEITAEFALAAASRSEELTAVEDAIERIGARYVADLRELSLSFNRFYETQLDAKEQQIGFALAERDAAQRERDELSRSLQAAEAAREGQEAQIVELRAQLTLAEDRAGQLSERDQELEYLRQALEMAERERDENALIIADLRDKFENTLALVATTRGDLAAREGDIARIEEQLLLIAADRDALRDNLDTRGRELAELTPLAAQLRDDLASERGTTADLRERIAALEQERDNLAMRIAEFRINGDNHLREVQLLCEELGRRAVAAERQRDDLLSHLRGLVT